MSANDDTTAELPRNLRVNAKAAPLREQVASTLRGAIVGGQFLPGQRLLERELIAMTTVSRTTIREALRQLESEGLIEIIPNRGPAVAMPTRRQVEEIYELRGLLESHASRQFASNSTVRQIEEFAELIDEFAAMVDSGAAVSVLRDLKERMYNLLFDGAGNSIASEVFVSINSRISILRTATLSSPERPAQTLAELRALLNAFQRRDADAAAALSADHVAQAAAVAMASIARHGG